MCEIKEITSAQAQAIFDNEVEGHREPNGMFIFPQRKGGFTAIDNRNLRRNDFCQGPKTESFDTRNQAEYWLLAGKDDAEEIRDDVVSIVYIQNGPNREYFTVGEFVALHHFLPKFIDLMCDISEMQSFSPLITVAEKLRKLGIQS